MYLNIFTNYLEKQKKIVFLKQTAAKQLGYLYEIWIYDNKGNKI